MTRARAAADLLKKWSDNGWLSRMDFDNHLKVLGPELDALVADAVAQAVKGARQVRDPDPNCLRYSCRLMDATAQQDEDAHKIREQAEEIALQNQRVIEVSRMLAAADEEIARLHQKCRDLTVLGDEEQRQREAAVAAERERYIQLLNAVSGHSQPGGPEPCWCFASTGAGDCHDEPQCVAALEAVLGGGTDGMNPWGALYESLRAALRAP